LSTWAAERRVSGTLESHYLLDCPVDGVKHDGGRRIRIAARGHLNFGTTAPLFELKVGSSPADVQVLGFGIWGLRGRNSLI